jgi:hypothetical protein
MPNRCRIQFGVCQQKNWSLAPLVWEEIENGQTVHTPKVLFFESSTHISHWPPNQKLFKSSQNINRNINILATIMCPYAQVCYNST